VVGEDHQLVLARGSSTARPVGGDVRDGAIHVPQHVEAVGVLGAEAVGGLVVGVEPRIDGGEVAVHRLLHGIARDVVEEDLPQHV